jgi:peptide-methionine (S)-S-oxide reductase
MIQEATLGAGCFWCIEACYKELKGVIDVYPGYAGGNTINPSYKDVCNEITGHAEVARVVFDDEQVSFDEILKVFWFVHDPTQLNRQGNDVGTQYRSVVFYNSDSQKEVAEAYMLRLTEEKVWEKSIVTEISPLTNFYRAEDYHHDYFANNPGNLYCQSVVRPKVEKFKKVFSNHLKD